MIKHDSEILVTQIRNIVQNKKNISEETVESEDLVELQRAITYLGDCLKESNSFLKSLSIGDLDVEAPSRHNFIAGNIKELHAGLRHLAWQANQVANGDYSQRVSFLGEFSDSFNKMITQLEERENKLKQQASAIMKSKDLLVSIMDSLSNWIVVSGVETKKILYANQSAKELFYDPDSNKYICGRACSLMDTLRNYEESEHAIDYEFTCPRNGKTLFVKSSLLQWNEEMAYAHVISDVTQERGELEFLESMAFNDELTGAYNRRYCMQTLEELIKKKKSFSLCMIDLDGLKYVNDKFGHSMGDTYIKTVSRCASSLFRKNDLLCRLGGDEFVVIFLNCSVDDAKERMDMLVYEVASIKLEFPMSISYGIVDVAKSNSDSAVMILSKADEIMYDYKKKHKKERK